MEGRESRKAYAFPDASDEIDLVIRDCVSFPDFLDLLEKKGYVVSRNTNRKYLTVRPPGAKRNFRLDRLGQGYTVEDIKQRIQHQLVQRSGDIPSGHRRPAAGCPAPGRPPEKRRSLASTPCICGTFICCGNIKGQPANESRMKCAARCSVWSAIRPQFLYLHKQDITTMEQLEARLEQLEAEIRQRTDQRQPLYTERRQTTDEEVQKMLTDQIAEQTAALRALRKERSLCRQIKNQIPDVQKNLPEFEKKRTMTQKEVMQHEHQRRSR